MLKEKKVLLGISGGIAVYKAVELASKIRKLNAQVKVIMTKNAMEFVTPLTFRTITNNTVSIETFNPFAPIEHISLADWADIFLIAPATANVIGKIANGLADDLLTTSIMAAKCPKLIVPAMNVNMYENPIVKNNIRLLSDLGYFFIEPETGFLACGYEGKGRFPETGEIVYHLISYLAYKKDLVGKRILVTAGACEEKIDPMRSLSNKSSGKMGFALARAAAIRGAEVTLIYAKTEEDPPYYINSKRAVSSEEMFESVLPEIRKNDVIIMAAAVTDYKPVEVVKEKMKKKKSLTLELTGTVDILKELSSHPARKILVGFAAETSDIVKNAFNKMTDKNLDFIIANSLTYLGQNINEVYVLQRGNKNNPEKITGDKFELANKILDQVVFNKA